MLLLPDPTLQSLVASRQEQVLGRQTHRAKLGAGSLVLLGLPKLPFPTDFSHRNPSSLVVLLLKPREQRGFRISSPSEVRAVSQSCSIARVGSFWVNSFRGEVPGTAYRDNSEHRFQFEV